MRISLLVAVGLLSACEVTDSQRATSACTAICECMAPPLPALQDQCVADCSDEVTTQLSDDCLACISEHDSCTTLQRDCEPICNPPEPPIFLDANQ